ncbi:ATP-binding protein [Streptomyces sp. NPDC004069]|uniref:ATP-binding protein n=1 Tax=Streptomyces sp. NPDC052043 TaxID=3365684 RepID=UPI0037D7B2D4
MSLPLTRRIARAALLVAAGAAAGVGAAGAAGAAPELPATPNLGGLTALDGASVGTTVDGAAHHVAGVAGDSGGKVVQQATPVARKAAGEAAGSAGGILGGAAQSVTKGGLPAQSLPVSELPLG